MKLRYPVFVLVGLLLLFAGGVVAELSYHGSLMLPLWFKFTPWGAAFITVDVITKHQFCQMILWHENPGLSAIFLTLNVYTVMLVGYLIGRRMW